MATILIYTSPARGHLFPILGAALALQARGHRVDIRTLAAEVDRVRALGLAAAPVAPAIDAREMDDWRGSNPLQALSLSVQTFGDRARLEVDDVQAAIAATAPDALLVDTNSWGAQAVAEASGLPWATFQPYLTPLPAAGVPPFGPGLPRNTSLPGRVRDGVLRRLLFGRWSALALPAVNATRARVGLPPLGDLVDLLLTPPRVFYMTVAALEYPRAQWPANFRLVGASRWEPAASPPAWLAAVDAPLALVTLSTERQNDAPLLTAALQGLPHDGLFVVATTAGHAPAQFGPPTGARHHIAQFLPHGPLLARAAVVVCHGGMGITQRALQRGVPLVVVPFGRDQLEVARRVEAAGAGVRLMPGKLSAQRLVDAVQRARALQAGAARMAAAFAAAGSDAAIADGMEALLPVGAAAVRATG